MDHIGRYQIVRELGRGAMGVVYHAIDPTIGRPVAIKTIRLREVDDAAHRERLRERLFREARSAGALSHPGIVTIYDMAEVDGLAYIAMEYVDGPTLDHLMSEAKPIPQETLFNILRQTSLALDYAHENGVVHRDIKPANIMMDATGITKITDFGIAKVSANDHYTITGTIIGTPNYMSPEQVQGIAIDGRSDQFSLAVIAYEILTGERPFPGEHLSTVVYKIVAEEPLSPQRLNPTLGPQIDAVLGKALAKKAAARYSLCADFIGALEAACDATPGWHSLARGSSSNMPTVVSSATAGKSSTGGKAVPLPPRPRTPPKKTSRVLPVMGAVVMALGLIGLIALQANPGWHFAWPWDAGAQQAAKSPKLVAKKQLESAPAPTQPSADSPAESVPPADAAAEKPLAAVHETAPPPRTSEPSVRHEPPKPQDIWITTNPPGATAMLDGSESTACQTPCLLQAAPGVHPLILTMAGMQTERREIRVGNNPQDFPLITMRPPTGILMVSTMPPGASISIDGHMLPQITPAQLSLSPGNHHLVVEKNGKRVGEDIEIKNGNTNFLKIPLNP